MGLVKWKYVGEFYLTVGVPAVYLAGLYFLSIGGGLRVTVVGKVLGIVITTAGLALWITSYLDLGKAFGVLPRAQKRVSTGVYKYLRHPMYLGISLVYLGIAIANESMAGLVFSFLVLIPLLGLRAVIEEKSLHK